VASVPALKPFQGLVKLVEGCCVTLFFVVSILYIRHTWLVLGLTNTVLGHQRAVEQGGVRYKVWINKTLKVDGCIKKKPSRPDLHPCSDCIHTYTHTAQRGQADIQHQC